MKVGLLAYHYALNYGAVLQIASLQRKIKSMGHECVIINFCSDGVLQWDLYQKLTFSKKILSQIKWNTYLFMIRKKKRREFDAFLKGLPMTEWIDKESIEELNDEFDLFIVGSDQVWNCFTMDSEPAYFLNFVKDKKKKNAYAASFGYQVIPEEYVDFTNRYLVDFNHISVRETHGQKIIKELKGWDVPVVLDPVFLSKAEDWNLNKSRLINYKYILVYQPQKSTTLGKKARKLAKEGGYKVIYISRTWDGVIGKKTINMSAVAPLDFLRLIRDAEFVVTNSFHGTAFSIIFHKQFWVEYNDGTSSRIESILDILNLKDRLLREETSIKSNFYIKYSEIDKKIANLIEHSESYISSMLTIG